MDPPTRGIKVVTFPGPVRPVEEATGGRAVAGVKSGPAPPPGRADIVSDALADIARIARGRVPGRFPPSAMAEPPGFGGDTEALSITCRRLFGTFLAEANERRDPQVPAAARIRQEFDAMDAR